MQSAIRRCCRSCRCANTTSTYRRLLYDDRILDMVEDLIGPNIQLFHDQALYKPARHGGPALWHQDNAYWRCSPPNLVSCWLTLDDVDVHNGAMQFLPGTHFRSEEHERLADNNALLDLGDKVDRLECGRCAAAGRRCDAAPLPDAALHRAERDRPAAAGLCDSLYESRHQVFARYGVSGCVVRAADAADAGLRSVFSNGRRPRHGLV